jgi:poly-beta-1,6-N-acetyl-D-glucosamine synthase
MNTINPSNPVNPSNSLTYVLITPARNEAAFIEDTIRSVIHQTVLPLKWIIVSDGSTDGTDDIVRRYTAEYSWMELVRMPERQERHFAGKVHAFNAGFERIKNLDYDVIASLDADLTFEEDYFSFLLDKFATNPLLGVGGTPFTEEGKSYDYRFFKHRTCFRSLPIVSAKMFRGYWRLYALEGRGN